MSAEPGRMLEFPQAEALTMGVELELQVVSPRDYDLTRGAADLLAALAKVSHPGDIKPEITESMLEISTSVQREHGALLDELRGIRDAAVAAANRLNLVLSGGGAHPFQHWSERRIFDAERFRHISDLYGYLAKQFTVFGQHIHIGCPGGDAAIYLGHALARYVPHFIALSASSPFFQGVDTAFDSSRLHAVSAFPLSGSPPCVADWAAFNEYFEKMRGLGIIDSMKDFYWDIRPKPEFGTIEIRVCDTPLTLERAAALAAYAQALARHLLAQRPRPVARDLYLAYGYNRFQACRFGLHGMLIDVETQQRQVLAADILATAQRLQPDAAALGASAALEHIVQAADGGDNDAAWMRAEFQARGTLADVVRLQADRFRE